MPDQLTPRQREILNFITASINERGYPPTLREIGEHFGIRSTNGVNDHLKALEKKGYLRREDLKSRAMRPVNMPPPNRPSNGKSGKKHGNVGNVVAGPQHRRTERRGPGPERLGVNLVSARVHGH